MELSSMENNNHDYRPLFKRHMGSGYFEKKAKDFRVTPKTISNVLGGLNANPAILDECLSELKEKLEQRDKALRRIHELTETHKQLQGA